MAKRVSHKDSGCGVARPLDAIGDRWSLLIVRDAFDGLRRFGEFQKDLGLAKNILAARLRTLVAHGIMDTVPASDGSPYQEYVLTQKGRGLFPLLVALRQWGEDFFRGGVVENERATTDIAGVFLGTVEVPCVGSSDPTCFTEEPVLHYYVQALDALDGVSGNLFQGNGGPDGTGFTNDLVLRFPKGTRLHGAIPVPEEVHTGLDVCTWKNADTCLKH